MRKKSDLFVCREKKGGCGREVAFVLRSKPTTLLGQKHFRPVRVAIHKDDLVLNEQTIKVTRSQGLASLVVLEDSCILKKELAAAAAA